MDTQQSDLAPMAAGFEPRRDDTANSAARRRDTGVPVEFAGAERTIRRFHFILMAPPSACLAVEQSIEIVRKFFHN